MRTLTFLCICFLVVGCSDVIENVVNCSFESVDFDLNHEVEPDNSNLVRFTVAYDGDLELDESIRWDFGDGTTSILTGAQASHEYLSPGTYEVKAEPTVRDGSSSCTPELIELVVIN